MIFEPLPIDGHLAAVRAALETRRALVLTAAPGAGKTTRVPPALVDRGPVLLLQPRRVAARAIARRIADERGWRVGGQVGWQVRFESRFTSTTELLVVTEGILTARLQSDPLLSAFATIVLDEFHERSLHADLGLTLAKQAWLARDDLRLVVMSATLDGGAVSRFLDGCPTIEVGGARHPLEIEYAPATPLPDAVRHAAARTSGNVLCFLPGAREIARAESALTTAGDRMDVRPLYGSLDAAAQDAALAPSSRRRIILATNIAETSLTVPGVTAVVDTGLHKVSRYDPARGIDSLTLERIPRDSADQRAGRAARLGPGLVVRLWNERDRLRAHREPEIVRVDLSAAVLAVLAWGGDPASLDWFEQPAPHRLQAALALLERLGAIAPALTPLGRQIERLPLNPRLARILLAGGGDARAAAACALLSEGVSKPAGGQSSTTCDLFPALDDFGRADPNIRAVARELGRLVVSVLGHTAPTRLDDEALRRALMTGYADRVARRRPGSSRLTLATGHGAVLDAQSGVVDAEWLIALDVAGAERGGVAEGVVRLASRVEREWLSPTAVSVEHAIDDASGRVRAFCVERYDAIELARRPVAADPHMAAGLLARTWLARGPDERTANLLRRARFAGLTLDLPALVSTAAVGAATLDEIDIAAVLPPRAIRDLASQAPERLHVPSGRTAALAYADDGSVSAAVKLQELFGLAGTPRLGPRRVPVIFHLLAPNGRAVQTTSDLESFWRRTYPDVRKELRGRYPRHPWPENPWTATPTARAKPRSG